MNACCPLQHPTVQAPPPAQCLTWGDERVGGSRGSGSAGHGVGAGIGALSLFEVVSRVLGWGDPGGSGPWSAARGFHGEGGKVGAGGAQRQAVHLQWQHVSGVGGMEDVECRGGSPGGWRAVGRVVGLAVGQVQGSRAGRR